MTDGSLYDIHLCVCVYVCRHRGLVSVRLSPKTGTGKLCLCQEQSEY